MANDRVTVNGINREIDSEWVTVNGVWRKVDKSSVTVNGVWREAYTSYTPKSYSYNFADGSRTYSGWSDPMSINYTYNVPKADIQEAIANGCTRLKVTIQFYTSNWGSSSSIGGFYESVKQTASTLFRNGTSPSWESGTYVSESRYGDYDERSPVRVPSGGYVWNVTRSLKLINSSGYEATGAMCEVVSNAVFMDISSSSSRIYPRVSFYATFE